MENPIKMDDLGVPIIFGNTHINKYDEIVIGQNHPKLWLDNRLSWGKSAPALFRPKRFLDFCTSTLASQSQKIW